MKILIADDERLVRLALRSMLEELYPNKYTFIDAKNGQELINLSKLHQPDICYVDINMPLLDGLSALKICKDLCPFTEWFILTGEAEFSFAKEALKIGVRNYLLKPVSIEELKENLDIAESFILNRNIAKNKEFELNVLSLLNPTIIYNDKITENTITLTKGNYTAILFFLDTSLSFDDKINFMNDITLQIKSNMKILLNSGYNYALINLLSGELCLIINTTIPKSISMDNILPTLDYNNSLITPIVSESCLTLAELYYKINEIKMLSALRILYKSGVALSQEKISNNQNLSILLPLSKKLILLYNSYKERNEITFIEHCNIILNTTNFKEVDSIINLKTLNRFFKLNFNILNNFSSLLELIEFLIEHYRIILYSSNNSNKDLVDKIMAYVKENYMNNIGVNTLASLYDITPNYLSKIFHEKSGVKFSDYITYIRVKEGKKMLLQNKDLNIKDVALKVGYYTPRHFTKQFFKIEGIYPSDLIKNKSN